MTRMTPQQIILTTSPAEWEVLRLVPLGLTDDEIGAAIFKTGSTVKTRLRRFRARTGIGATRAELADFYLQYRLESDIGGSPLMPDTPAFTRPGQKLQDWTAWAEIQREMLLSGDKPQLTRRSLEAFDLYLDPRYLDKIDKQLARMLRTRTGKPMPLNTFKWHIHHVTSGSPQVVTRQYLLTVNRLAPLRKLLASRVCG